MLRCLIADDSQTMRKIIKANLEKCGIKKIEEAVDGAQAIQKFASMKGVDIMFLDINMPIKTGKEVVELLGQRKMLDDTRIIIISTDIGAENKAFFLKHNITDFIPKPFNINSFNEIVTPLLENTKKSDETEDSVIAVEKSLSNSEYSLKCQTGNIILEGKDGTISINIKRAIQVGALEADLESLKTEPKEDMKLLNETLTS
ncbi:MAG: response regulator, partial [Campylobacterales bacterium]